MAYFGQWRSFFGWHTEDADLYSINFNHWGAPKVWYCVAPSHRAKFERMAEVRGGRVREESDCYQDSFSSSIRHPFRICWTVSVIISSDIVQKGDLWLSLAV